MNKYYTAQICENGHVISSVGDSSDLFCEECGSKIINSCPSCNSPIRGQLNDDSFIVCTYNAPKHCPKCGEAYPWTK